jgi:hypothetical protein
MKTDGSVTRWIEGAKQGEDSAVYQAIWIRYFDQLVTLARQLLHENARGAADEEDIAINVLDCICRGFKNGRFNYVDNRNILWKVLNTLISRRVFDHHQRVFAAPNNVTYSINVSDSEGSLNWLDQIADKNPSPAEAYELIDTIEAGMRSLTRDYLKSVAIQKLEGLTNKEIAKQEGVIEETIRRRVDKIRDTWTKHLGIDPA